MASEYYPHNLEIPEPDVPIKAIGTTVLAEVIEPTVMEWPVPNKPNLEI